MICVDCAQVAFPAQGDLGIGIKVDKDGRVVVSDVTQLKGICCS